VGHSRRATVADLRRLAGSMPGVAIERGPKGNDVYQVSRRSFVFFRTPRPDAFDPTTGERYQDVVVLWVGDEGEKQALVADESTPVLHDPALRRSSVGAAAHLAHRRAHLRRARRGRVRRLARPGVEDGRSEVARRARRRVIPA
jgi:hypothetical protein